MLPAEKDLPNSEYVAVTALEMGTKTVYPFVPTAERKNYGLFIKLQNVSDEDVTVKVLIAPPLSSLETCNRELAISPGKEAGVICMQSVPVPNADYTLQARVYGESGSLLEDLELTVLFSADDVSALVVAVEGK